MPNPQIIQIHNQIHPNSCIPMSVEYVLKEERIVNPNFFDYQSDPTKHWVSGWVPQINLPGITFIKEDNLQPNQILNRVDQELKAGRMVIISLQIQWNPNNWHMYIVYEELENGTYNVVTSTPGLGHSQIENKDLANLIPIMTGVNLITYSRF